MMSAIISRMRRTRDHRAWSAMGKAGLVLLGLACYVVACARKKGRA